MSEEIRITRSLNSLGNASSPGQTQSTSPRSKLPWLILGVLVLGLIILGALFRDRLFPRSGSGAGQATPAEKYQAVFLANGQVYFGKLATSTSDYVTLRDIYYLQVTQPPLQGSADKGQQQSTQGQQPQISLMKLGNELHGPEDEMYISRTQLLFYENLKEEGQVVKAIKEYKVNPPKQSPK